MKRKKGFTLAEVLITLTIIGVVAAVTLPTLNSNTGAVRNRALLKKGLYSLNSAVRMNEANNGWNFSGLTTSCDADGNVHRADTTNSICGLINSSISGEEFLGPLEVSGTPTDTEYRFHTDVPTSGNHFIHYQLNDGMIIGLRRGGQSCTEEMSRTVESADCVGFIDVNGMQGPHRVIQCETDTDTKLLWQEGYASCEVNRNTTADIFPIVFYDGTVELSTNAGKAFFNAR